MRKLPVSVAYHSEQMKEVAPMYHSLLGDLCCGVSSPSDPVMVSSVTGSKVTKEELAKSEYWVRNLVSPVQFLEALKSLGTKWPAMEKPCQVSNRPL